MFFNSGVRGARAKDGVGSVANRELFVQKKDPVPSITSWAIQGSDDTSLDPAGGQTVVVTGTGFASGLTGIVGSTTLASVTVVSPTTATFTSTAKSAGSYTLILSNASGAAAIYVPGITYSSIPTYTTAAGSIGSNYETTAISTQVVATSDSAITYSLATGALPSGSTLYANGVITGTAPVDSSSTTYSFSIKATDAELQDVTRSFTLTINTDVVTWSSPGSGTTYTVVGNTPISNVTLSATSAAGYGVTYTANALPTGVTLSSGVISGTPTVEANTTSLLTATASTTNRSATNTIYWVVTLNDQYFKYNSLLMSSTVVTNTFATDLSSNNFDITIAGDTKPSKFDPFKLGYYSGFFDGSTSKLTFPTSSSMSLDGQFTIECWVYWSGTSIYYQNFIGSNNTFTSNASFFRVWGTSSPSNANKIGIGNPTHDAGSSVFSTNNLVTNTWNHVAATRDGSNIIRVFINGALEKTGSTDSSLYDFGQGGTCIGDSPWDGAQGWYSGYISNLRVLKGTCLYTTTFTPSTTPLTAVANTSLLTCQSSRFIDNSANAFAITVAGTTLISPFQPFTPNSSYATYGSTYFDGTGDYLTCSYLASNFGSSDFTVEAWLFNTTRTDYNIILDTRSGATANPFVFGITSSGYLYYYSGTEYASSTIVSLNTWTHVSIARSGTTIKLFQNGVETLSRTDSSNLTGTSTGLVVIGVSNQNTFPFFGYISNFRIVKGTAVYTATFTPPTTPLTAITNTSLLTCQTTVPQTTSVFVDESSFNNSITRNGNTNIGTFSPLNGSWSNYFDGTGDYLQTPSSTFSLGTVFTVEAWVYPTTSPTNAIVFASTSSGEFSLGYYSNTGFGVSGRGVTWLLYSATMPVVGAWNHVAVVRAGLSTNQTSIYINGTRVVNGTISSAFTTSGTWQVGYDGGGGGTSWTGYISNLRVVAGTDVYGYTNTTITPPTAPLNSIANTKLLTCNSPSFVDYSPVNNVLTRNGDTAVNKFSPFPGYITNFTSYSGFFDGTGDYLSAPYNVALAPQSSSFTVEAWVYFSSSVASSQHIISNVNNTSGDGDWALFYRADQSRWEFYCTSTGFLASAVRAYNTTVPVVGTWYHVAGVKNGSTTSCYVNGVKGTDATISTVNTSSGVPYFIGAGAGPTALITGYISNLRVVKGTAVYTANFTPSTTPLTAIANTSLLTCQSTTFIDNSTNAFAITVAGDAKPMIQNPFVNTFTSPVAYSPTTTGSSMYFDGTGDYLTTPSSVAFAFGTANYTMECWVYLIKTSYCRLWYFSSDNDNIDLNTNSIPGQISYYNGSSSTASSANITLNSWAHIAVVRSSGTVKVYLNGVSVISQATTPNTSARTFNLSYSSDPLGAYISNFRMVKGTAVYTAPFVPSGQPLPAVQNTTLLVSSTITPPVYDAAELSDIENTGTAKLTTSNSPYYSSYSGYFDGTGDYLTVPSNAALQFGTGDFTIEGWIYPTSPSGDTPITASYQTWATSVNFYFALRAGSPNVLIFRAGDSLPISLVGNTSVLINTWTHVAVARSSGVTKIFVNGVVQTATHTGSVNISATALATGIGASQGGLEPFTGYISNLRMVKGTAVYTATFTPSTTPLTAIANTSLLICQSNRFIDNSTNAFAITKVGNTRVSTVQPFGSSNLTKYSSAYFATKTDTFGMRPQPGLTTFAGDFTLECWVYPSDSSPDNWSVYDARQTGQTAANFVFGLEPLPSPVSGSFRMVYYNTTSNYGNGITVFKNQWTYLAWVRSGTTMTYYVNGVSAGSNTVSGAQTASATTNLVVIGSKDSGLAAYGTLGYIADLRITNGYARYTTTFTPPTTPLLGF